LPHDIVYDPVHDLIGDGQYGIVYKGRCRGLEVAVKTPHKQTLPEAQLTSFRHEVEMMSKISHPNVVRFMGACTEDGKLQIVTERCRTNLENLLASSVPLSLYERMRMARDAALGMTWLHEIKMVHRDLKTANLLVDFNNRVKVADFGFSQIKASDSLAEPKGTLVWMAPEMILGARYNEKVDVYSFGIILWEIYTRQKPYPHHADPQLFCNSVCFQNERPDIPPNTPPSLVKLITSCWNGAPSERPSFNQISQSLSEIMVDCVVQNESAAKFWKKYFLNHHDDEKVEWEVFEECLCKEIGFQLFEGSTFLNPLFHILLVDDGKETEFVTLERFDKVVKWVGPFFDAKNGQKVIAEVGELSRQSWFHGDIDSVKANSNLAALQPGTFLIRFSSSDPKVFPFTLSMVRAGHVRIERNKDGFKVWGKQYKSLKELVENNKNILQHPCPKKYVELYNSVDEPTPISNSVSDPTLLSSSTDSDYSFSPSPNPPRRFTNTSL
jgi:serine/threonine protein kinase